MSNLFSISKLQPSLSPFLYSSFLPYPFCASHTFSKWWWEQNELITLFDFKWNSSTCRQDNTNWIIQDLKESWVLRKRDTRGWSISAQSNACSHCGGRTGEPQLCRLHSTLIFKSLCSVWSENTLIPQHVEPSLPCFSSCIPVMGCSISVVNYLTSLAAVEQYWNTLQLA